jgi:hypothetical protein
VVEADDIAGNQHIEDRPLAIVEHGGSVGKAAADQNHWRIALVELDQCRVRRSKARWRFSQGTTQGSAAGQQILDGLGSKTRSNHQASLVGKIGARPLSRHGLAGPFGQTKRVWFSGN